MGNQGAGAAEKGRTGRPPPSARPAKAPSPRFLPPCPRLPRHPLGEQVSPTMKLNTLYQKRGKNLISIFL